MKWFTTLFAGRTVLMILVDTLPKVIEDGKISLPEVTDLIMKIAAVFDYKLTLTIPKEMQGVVIDVVDMTKIAVK